MPHPILQEQPTVLTLLQDSVDRKQKLIVQAILKILITLQDSPPALAIALEQDKIIGIQIDTEQSMKT